MSKRTDAYGRSITRVAAKLYKDGLKYQEIAGRLGISVALAKSKVKAGLDEDPKMTRHRRG
jgi:DNA-binding transcriptional regulator LsrR (DeoR family)